MTETLAGLGDLADRFDHFLIDQFGVLLDGVGCYPFAASALGTLAARGKQIVLLSNSGRRAAPNIARLTGLGFAPDSYRALVSSGEVAFRLLRGRSLPPGSGFLLIGRGGDTTATDGLGLVQTDRAEAAGLVIISGAEPERFSLPDYQRQLEPAARLGLPALCTNPDKVMLTAGGPAFAAGRIAEAYQAMGGSVEWIGKPYPAVYAAALAALGHPDPARVVCIGDSLEHDIAGGAAAGMATALVRTGVGAGLTGPELAAAICAAAARPTFVLPRFAF